MSDKFCPLCNDLLINQFEIYYCKFAHKNHYHYKENINIMTQMYINDLYIYSEYQNMTTNIYSYTEYNYKLLVTTKLIKPKNYSSFLKKINFLVSIS